MKDSPMYALGTFLKIKDPTDGRQYRCKIVDTGSCHTKIHYVGWNSRYDEWLRLDDQRLQDAIVCSNTSNNNTNQKDASVSVHLEKQGSKEASYPTVNLSKDDVTDTVYGPVTSEEFDKSPEAAQCLQCGQINLRKRHMIKCDECKLWAHYFCVGLTGAAAVELPNPTIERNEDGSTDNLEELISKCKTIIRILPRIPKGARAQVAEAYSECIQKAMNQKTDHAWTRVLCFAYSVLKQPERSTAAEASGNSLAATVKKQANLYIRSNTLPEMPSSVSRKSKVTSDPYELLAKRISAKFADGDVKGAVRIVTSADGLAEYNDKTIQALRTKHPGSPLDLNLPAPPDTNLVVPVSVAEGDLQKIVNSFPHGSAAGPDGIRPVHLKDLLGKHAGAAGENLKKSLTQFVNTILSGEVPLNIVPIFYGASLCALNKTNGDIRPIAVGNTIRRLAAKAGLAPSPASLGGELRPTQLGFGTSGGCEAAVHATRKFVQEVEDKQVPEN